MPISSSPRVCDLVGQVAGRHLARALGELLDGAGDAARQVEAEPREREDDDQGHQEEEQDVDALDRVLQELELLVLQEGLRDPAHLLLEPLGHVGADHHRAHHVAVAAARRPDRRHRLDEVAGGQLAHGRDLLAGQSPAQLVLAQIAGRQIMRSTDNVVSFNESSERHTETWSGVDVSMTARLGTRDRLTFISGGFSSGSTSYSNCEVIDNPGLFTASTNFTGNITSRYCSWETGYRTQLKLAAVHTFWKGIQAAATFQSNPGPMVRAIWNATNAVVAPSLGRNLVGYPSGYPIDLIEPGTRYGDRLNQLDLRFAKLFEVPGGRLKAMVDVYNALNANPAVSVNTTYGANWLRPTQILVARFVKVGAQFEF